MKQIPPQSKDEPEIFLFENLSELQKHLGHQRVQGYYDPKQNKIFATPESLAHEIAHYKDHKSGKFIHADDLNSSEKIAAKIRNEAVAILYAWQKSATPEKYFSFEKEFLELVYFAMEKADSPSSELKGLRFSELQELATWICRPEQPWHNRLHHLFRHYLRDELCTTYSN